MKLALVLCFLVLTSLAQMPPRVMDDLMNLATRPQTASVASFTVTTTAPTQTLNIGALTTSSSMTVDWGDGNQNAYSGAQTPSHTYAAAGTYTVRFLSPLLVTVFNISDAKVTLNSSGIKTLSNILTFQVTSLNAGTFNSSDVSAWRPTTFGLYSMPAGYAGTFNSSDVSAWNPSNFYLYGMPAGYAGTFNSTDISAWRPSNFYLLNMPAGYAGTFNSADISAWRPTVFYLSSMPAGYAGTFNSADVTAWRPSTFLLLSMPAATFTITITVGGFAAWTTVTTLNMYADNLTQAQVNQILTDCYTAFATRSVTGGTIVLNGTGNAAPSGTYQSVTPPTSGEETAYDLINDPTSINPTHKWATITTN